MIDFSRVQNYYIACGYTNMRKQIDGLAALVQMQFPTEMDAQNQKAHLCAFLEHGEIEISNNQVENAIRPFVVGRKGWLFADTPQGAEASAIIYSLMETAKANNLRLDDYLLHLLSVLPERAERSKDFELDDLLPWSEEMRSWFSAV